MSSIAKVKEYLARFGAAGRVMELDHSSATVELAAQALGGGGICSQENTYDSNGVALELDSGSAMLCGSNMNNSRVLRNGVAIRVKRLPVEWMTLELYDCSFYGNTVDLDDPQGLVVRR